MATIFRNLVNMRTKGTRFLLGLLVMAMLFGAVLPTAGFLIGIRTQSKSQAQAINIGTTIPLCSELRLNGIGSRELSDANPKIIYQGDLTQDREHYLIISMPQGQDGQAFKLEIQGFEPVLFNGPSLIAVSLPRQGNVGITLTAMFSDSPMIFSVNNNVPSFFEESRSSGVSQEELAQQIFDHYINQAKVDGYTVSVGLFGVAKTWETVPVYPEDAHC